MLESCGTCGGRRAGEAQFCETLPTLSYDGEKKHLACSYGEYSENIVVDEAFVLRVSG